MIKKVGMEFEVSAYREGGEIEWNEWDEIEYSSYSINQFVKNKYIKGNYWENEVIVEFQIKPVLFRNTKNFIRRFLILTSDLCWDFEYYQGLYDTNAESNHLHISLNSEIENIRDDEDIYNSLILFLQFYSRNNNEFRDAIYDRAYIKYLSYLSEDSKGKWITTKSFHNGWEIRINENPLPLFLYLVNYHLYQMKYNSKYFGIVKSFIDNLYYDNELSNFKKFNKEILFLFKELLFMDNNIFNYYKKLYDNNKITNYKLIWKILGFYKEADWKDREINIKLYDLMKEEFKNDKIYNEYKECNDYYTYEY
jgi:hypothetical protein